MRTAPTQGPDRNRENDELQIFVLHCLAMPVAASGQTGLTQLLDAMHLPLVTGRLGDLGGRPIAARSCKIRRKSGCCRG